MIGLEFATIFSNMGSKVTIVEFLDRALALWTRIFPLRSPGYWKRKVFGSLTAHKCLSLENGVMKAEDMRGGKIVEIAAPMSLIAIGRNAVVHEETYQKLGLQFTRKGVGVDDHQRTNVPGIWAVGDATGRSILAHVGIQQGIIAAENIMKAAGESLRKMDYEVIPAVIYTMPESLASALFRRI